ncbi:MAG: GGDEF domain-containing protein [Alteromonadaceae bacterium]|nr:GGDEF domain-containing protein [Alteromonadaceae bacterium]
MPRKKFSQTYLIVLIKKNRHLLTYLAGLLMVGAAVTASHILVDRKMSVTRTAARILELGHEQSLLAERVNHLSYRYVLGATGGFEQGVDKALVNAVSRMHRNHLTLLREPAFIGFAAAADDIYFAPQYELDLKIRTFLGAARELAHRNPASVTEHSPLVRFLDAEKTQELHDLLEKTVNIYKASAEKALSAANKTLWTLYVLIILVLLGEGLLVSRLIVASLARQAEEYRELAHTDPLTGCRNRRSFMQAAREEQGLVNRGGHQSALLMLDIDHFKNINDTWGHATGDEVIRALVNTCLTHLRGNDVLGRLGGEEFAVLLRGASAKNAARVGEALRQHLEDCSVELQTNGELVDFTASIGVAALSAEDDSPLDALERADQALYIAKTSGRNRVVVG